MKGKNMRHMRRKAYGSRGLSRKHHSKKKRVFSAKKFKASPVARHTLSRNGNSW